MTKWQLRGIRAAFFAGSFVSDKVACALQTVPQVCVFPYSVYSQVFAGSIETWEAVKAGKPHKIRI